MPKVKSRKELRKEIRDGKKERRRLHNMRPRQEPRLPPPISALESEAQQPPKQKKRKVKVDPPAANDGYIDPEDREIERLGKLLGIGNNGALSVLAYAVDAVQPLAVHFESHMLPLNQYLCNTFITPDDKKARAVAKLNKEFELYEVLQPLLPLTI
jgi:hypothetical protein